MCPVHRAASSRDRRETTKVGCPRSLAFWGPGRPQRPTVGPRLFPSQHCARAPSIEQPHRAMGGRPQKSGAPGPSHLGTWETTKVGCPRSLAFWGPGRPQRPTVGPRLFPSQHCARAPSIERIFARWAGDHKSRVPQVPRIWGPGRPQRPTVGPRLFPSQHSWSRFSEIRMARKRAFRGASAQ